MRILRLLNIDNKYIPSNKTNVLETFKRLGFEPPSEDPRYQAKWRRYRFSNAINERSKE
jgi:hypothetical protein